MEQASIFLKKKKFSWSMATKLILVSLILKKIHRHLSIRLKYFKSLAPIKIHQLMSTKPTFYTAFANSEKNFIPNLSEEAMKISDLMQDLAFNDKLYYIKDEVFNMDRLVKNFL